MFHVHYVSYLHLVCFHKLLQIASTPTWKCWILLVFRVSESHSITWFSRYWSFLSLLSSHYSRYTHRFPCWPCPRSYYERECCEPLCQPLADKHRAPVPTLLIAWRTERVGVADGNLLSAFVASAFLLSLAAHKATLPRLVWLQGRQRRWAVVLQGWGYCDIEVSDRQQLVGKWQVVDIVVYA